MSRNPKTPSISTQFINPNPNPALELVMRWLESVRTDTMWVELEVREDGEPNRKKE